MTICVDIIVYSTKGDKLWVFDDSGMSLDTKKSSSDSGEIDSAESTALASEKPESQREEPTPPQVELKPSHREKSSLTQTNGAGSKPKYGTRVGASSRQGGELFEYDIHVSY